MIPYLSISALALRRMSSLVAGSPVNGFAFAATAECYAGEET